MHIYGSAEGGSLREVSITNRDQDPNKIEK